MPGRSKRGGRAVKARTADQSIRSLLAVLPGGERPTLASGYFNVPEAAEPKHACDLRRQVVERAGLYATAHGAPTAPLDGDVAYFAHHAKAGWLSAERRDTSRDPAAIGRAQGTDAMRRYHDMNTRAKPEVWLDHGGKARRFKGAGPSDVE